MCKLLKEIWQIKYTIQTTANQKALHEEELRTLRMQTILNLQFVLCYNSFSYFTSHIRTSCRKLVPLMKFFTDILLIRYIC